MIQDILPLEFDIALLNEYVSSKNEDILKWILIENVEEGCNLMYNGDNNKISDRKNFIMNIWEFNL